VDRPEKLLKEGKSNGKKAWTSHNLNEVSLPQQGGMVRANPLTPGKGRASDGEFFSPLDIGNNSTIQAQWIAAKWPHFNDSLIQTIQSIYHADTYKTPVFSCRYPFASQMLAQV